LHIYTFKWKRLDYLLSVDAGNRH